MVIKMAGAVQKENRIVALYPMTKFYIAIAFAIVAVVLPGIISKAVCFAALNVLALASGIYKVFVKRVKNSVGVLFIVLVIIQTFFAAGDTILFSFWIFSAKLEGLLFALKLGFVLANIGGCLIWFFAITTEKEFVLALEKKGLSSKASYVVLSTLQMVPVLKKRSETIMNAQRARGVETEGSLFIRAKVFVPTIVPLVLSSIQGTEERALTLEARGFSVETKSTHLYDIEPKPIDKTVSLITGIVFILIMVGRIALWLI